MELTSWQYIVFVLILGVLYYGAKINQKWLLLAANVIFFVSIMQNNAYTIVELVLACMITWYGAKHIEKSMNGKKIVIAVVTADLAILILCKYLSVGLIPMIGISYYMLSLISYAVDVYWNVIPAEKSYTNILLFTSYFPLLTSGPIVKYEQMESLLKERREYSYDTVRRGMVRLMFGMCKKLILATRFSSLASTYFINWEYYHGIYIWLAMAEFFFELYFDFSGCMDIIIGTSQILGIELPENFNLPLFSRTVSEFWRRWHITLGGWFKEYFLYPILKSDLWINGQDFCKKYFPKKLVKNIFTWTAMFLLWILIGLWHGFGLTFLFEGLFFGCCIIIEQILEKPSKKIRGFFHISDKNFVYSVFQMCRTFILISIGLLFFHSDSIQMAFGCLKNALVFGHGFSLHGIYGRGTVDFIGFALVFLAWFVANVISYIKNDSIIDIIFRQKTWVRWICYYTLVLSICFLGEFGSVSFIYAKF